MESTVFTNLNIVVFDTLMFKFSRLITMTWKQELISSKRYIIMDGIMRKHAFGICENKGTDQLHSNHAAETGPLLSLHNSKIPLGPKSEISSLFEAIF